MLDDPGIQDEKNGIPASSATSVNQDIYVPDLFDEAYVTPERMRRDLSTASLAKEMEDFYYSITPAHAKLTAAQIGNPADPQLVASLKVGITPDTLGKNLGGFVSCASVTMRLRCCATCGRRPLPDIHLPVQPGRAPLVQLGALVNVPLSQLGRLHPWTRLTRGKCTACVARGPKGPPCEDIFEQVARVEGGWVNGEPFSVPWPPAEGLPVDPASLSSARPPLDAKDKAEASRAALVPLETGNGGLGRRQ